MRRSFVLFLLTTFCIIRPAAAQTDTSRMTFGMNFNVLSYWNRELPFVDVMKMSGLWGTIPRYYAPFGPFTIDTGVRDSLPMDADGYPTVLPYVVAGQDSPQIVITRMLFGQSGIYPSGQYICLYDGDGEIGFSGDATVVSRTPGRIVLSVTPTNAGIYLWIFRSVQGNHIRRIRVLMPGTEGTYETQPFHAAFLQKIQPFNPLRFMTWEFVNNTNEVTWTNRKKPTYYTQASYYVNNRPSGVAYEHVIALCNQLGKDAWINVPYTADSLYVRNMAVMFRDSLKPGLKIYLEYNNEAWNPIFPVYAWIEAHAPANLNHPQKTAVFIKRTFDIWADVFGGQMSARVVRVAGGQLANPWVAQQTMLALGQGGADAISPAAYYILRPENYDSLEAKGASATAADVARMVRSWFPTLATLLQQHQQVADQYKLRLLFYEGSGEIRPRTPSNPSTQALYAFQRDTSVYNVSMEWFRLIRSVTHADKFVFFHLASRADDVNEGFGALLNVFEATSPKYQAMLDYMNGGPAAVSPRAALPEGFGLQQNFPNPFNPSTTVRFRLASAGLTDLSVYDLLGRTVATLAEGMMSAGEHEAVFAGNGRASGVYLCRLRSGGHTSTITMHLVK